MADFSSIPHDLPPRFQIRRLEEKHIPWANAIVMHSNLFHSPVWSVTYPENKCERAYACFREFDYLATHQIISGHSFGVFDTEYKFKRPESGSEGKLYWDENNPSKDETGGELLSQMDFPLCSVALAYDGINALDMEKVFPLIACLPAFGTFYHNLEVLDPRKPESWKPTGPNQVLMRNATSSRYDVEGKGIMKKLAYFLMHYAYSVGFRGIQIECAHDKVTSVWMHPPAPYKSNLVSEFNSWEYSEDEEVDGTKTGNKINPYNEAKQRFTKIYVELRPGAEIQAQGGDTVVPQNIGALG